VDVNIFEGYAITGTASSGVYVNNSVFPASHVTAITDFTEYSGLYQEYRILGFSCHFFPVTQYAAAPNSPINNSTPMFLCPSQLDETLLSGDVLAFAHEGKRMSCLTTPNVCTVKMVGAPNSSWAPCSVPVANNMCIKTYIKVGTTSASSIVNLGYFYLVYNVQFRQRTLTDVGMPKSKLFSSYNSLPLPVAKESKDSKDSKDSRITRDGDTTDEPVFVVPPTPPAQLAPATSSARLPEPKTDRSIDRKQTIKGVKG
jgi:hypothetical protein